MPTRTAPVHLAGRIPLGTEGILLPPSFYMEDDSLKVAEDLLGKVLCTALPGGYASGIIVETEAYKGKGDAACHAHEGRHTERTSVMYRAGGVAYVYLCYGLHHLFNIITGPEGEASAVLIRALEPLDGKAVIAGRRNMAESNEALLRGPGAMSQGLGISKLHYGASLTGSDVWLEDRGITISPEETKRGPRIGVDYAGADAQLPWRLWVAGSRYVSGKRT